MIREACVLDLPRVAQLGEAYIQETGLLGKYPIDLTHANLCSTFYIHNEDALFLVAVHESQVIGFFMAAVAPLPWSSIRIALDSLLYIQPKHRGRAYGIQLIRRYESWAASRGCKEVQLSIASGITEDRTCALYERMGYLQIGRQFRKEI